MIESLTFRANTKADDLLNVYFDEKNNIGFDVNGTTNIVRLNKTDAETLFGLIEKKLRGMKGE